MSNQEQKQGRGRPKGSFSYAMIETAELPKIAKIKGFLPVSKRFLTSIGVDISSFKDFTGMVEPRVENTPKKVEKVVKAKAEVKPKAAKKAKKVEEQAPIQATLEA